MPNAQRMPNDQWPSGAHDGPCGDFGRALGIGAWSFIGHWSLVIKATERTPGLIQRQCSCSPGEGIPGKPGHPFFPQHCLYFLPLPQGHGSLRPTLGPTRTGLALARASAASLTTSLGLPSAVAAPELPVAVARP